MEMSRREGTIEELNHTGNPHWIVSRGKETNGNHVNGNALPTTSPWDRRCFECVLRREVARLGIHITSFRAVNGSVQLQTLATSEMHRQLLRALEENNVYYEIVSATTTPPRSDTKGLTRHQLEVLRIALREGFYEYPRRTDLQGLGKLLGCSPSSLCETLRRGERALIGNYLQEHAR